MSLLQKISPETTINVRIMWSYYVPRGLSSPHLSLTLKERQFIKSSWVSFEPSRSPVVTPAHPVRPASCGEVDVARAGSLLQDRCHQKVVPQEKLRIYCPGHVICRRDPPQGSDDRSSSSRGFSRQRNDDVRIVHVKMNELSTYPEDMRVVYPGTRWELQEWQKGVGLRHKISDSDLVGLLRHHAEHCLEKQISVFDTN